MTKSVTSKDLILSIILTRKDNGSISTSVEGHVQSDFEALAIIRVLNQQLKRQMRCDE